MRRGKKKFGLPKEEKMKKKGEMEVEENSKLENE